MFKKIRELRKLKKLEKRGDVSITFDNHTPESLKKRIDALKKEVLETINIVGWFIVFLILTPLVLSQTRLSGGSIIFITQFILFSTLFLIYMIKSGWNNSETKIIFYYLISQILIYLIILWNCGGSFCWEIAG